MNAIYGLTAFIALLAFGGASESADRDETGEESLRLVEAPGREATVARCAMCHSLDYIQMNAVVMDRTGWQKSIQKMIERFGAPIAPEEAREILEYLSSNYNAEKSR